MSKQQVEDLQSDLWNAVWLSILKQVVVILKLWLHQQMRNSIIYVFFLLLT